jgi:protein TonB
MPAAASAALHGVMLGGLLLATLIPLGSTSARTLDVVTPQPMRLVYLNLPGPGGGGGGGGMRLKRPATQARREGKSSLSSPLPDRKPVPEQPAPRIEEPPPPPPTPPEPLPPVEAPVVARGSDPVSEAGVLEERAPAPPSRGSGEGGGAGTGQGVGLGEGRGSGIGEGEGGGEGGGPFRPGSGIAPPRLLSEVKPDYTEDARRRGLEGEVVLEIVVRRDGRVGDVRVMKGLGAGLDQQAVQAVRRWQFAAATRKGRPVDVIVEVAVEFKLR